MIILLTSAARRLGRGLLLAGLAAGYSAAHAQVTPKPMPAPPPAPQNLAYYVDSKPATSAEASQLKPDDILYMDVVKSAADKQKLGLSKEDGAVLITTKANASSPAVVAFNKQFPVTPATPAQNQAEATIKAYVARHYPTAKLEMAGPVADKADRYKAVFMENGKRVYLLFDGAGNVVTQ